MRFFSDSLVVDRTTTAAPVLGAGFCATGSLQVALESDRI